VSRQRSSNDNRPSLVEIMMYRYKAIIGWRLRARLPHQRIEAKIGCSVVNRNWADTRSHRNNRRCVHQGVFEGMLL
jgi:hypothetical protein